LQCCAIGIQDVHDPSLTNRALDFRLSTLTTRSMPKAYELQSMACWSHTCTICTLLNAVCTCPEYVEPHERVTTTSGKVELTLDMNRAPFGGTCSISNTTGNVLWLVFLHGWVLEPCKTIKSCTSLTPSVKGKFTWY